MGYTDTLIMGPYFINRKDAGVGLLLGRVGEDGNVKYEPQCPVRVGPFSTETTTSVSDNAETTKSITRVRMTSRAV